VGHGVAPASGSHVALLGLVAALVAGRNRPIGAAIVGLVFSVAASLAVRWPLVDLTIAVAVGGGLLLLSRRGAGLHSPTRSGPRVALVVCAALALLLGIASVFATPAYLPSGYRPLVPWLIVICSLLWRPDGVFAEAEVRRA
jgi:branched-subunit amino acid ABC-type transport system permease component